MSDYLTGARTVALSADTLNYILRCMGGFASAIKSGAVTNADAGNPTATGDISHLSNSSTIYKGSVSIVVEDSTLIARMIVPAQVSGTITEMVLISGNTATGEVVLVGRLPRSVVKKRGISLEVAIKFTIATN
jgi:hypothetical protein